MVSLFRELQMGKLILSGEGVPYGAEIDTSVTLQKLLSHPDDVVEIYALDEQTMGQLNEADSRFMASMGVTKEDLTRFDDVRAADDLFFQLRLQSPFMNKFQGNRRIAFEIRSEDGKKIEGIVIEVQGKRGIKSLFEAEQWFVKKLGADVNEHGQISNAKLMATGLIVKPSMLFDGPKEGKSGIGYAIFPMVPKQGAMLLPGLGAPFLAAGGEVGKGENQFRVDPAVQDRQANAIMDLILAATILFHALGRDPTLIVQQVVAAGNEKRGSGKHKTISPIRNITIDPVRYARIISSRAKDIQEAFESKGGYRSIEGLVLVSGYVTKAGTTVEPYSRCADIGVKREVDKLLRATPVNYQELAEFVDAFGAAQTRAKQNASHVHEVRMGPPVRNALPESEPKTERAP